MLLSSYSIQLFICKDAEVTIIHHYGYGVEWASYVVTMCMLLCDYRAKDQNSLPCALLSQNQYINHLRPTVCQDSIAISQACTIIVLRATKNTEI